MKTIKFRGTVIHPELCDNVKTAEGSLTIYKTGVHTHIICPLEGKRNYPVDPKSIRQLVGYDKNGKEIYEGDVVVDEFGQEFVAELMPVGMQRTKDGEAYTLDLFRLTLKEGKDND